MELFKLLGTIAIDNSEANKSIDETTGKATSSESTMSGAFKKIGAAVATYFTTTAIINFGKECVNAASDVEEMQNKFDVVFSGMNETVSQWAEDYASSIGRNSNTIKGYLADNQNMFVGMGMTRDAGADLSEQMVTLALDLASFNNLQEPDAVNALSKALMGESESAKSLGAVLNDNTISMAMNKMGIEGKFDALSEAEKMEVRYQAILMQSSDAIGDCERSLDSYKGQTIQLQSAKEKLYETIGQMLMPIMTQFVGILTTVVTWLQSGVEWLQQHETAMTLLAVCVATLTTALIAYNIVQNAAAIATGIATAATAAFGAVMAFVTSPITLVILAIGALVAAGVLLYKNWDTVKEKCSVVASFMFEKFNAAKEKVLSVFDGIKNGIQTKINAARDFVHSAIDKIKGFFNFNWSLPSLKLPHPRISGSFSLNPPSVPSFGIDWYKDGGVLTEPTAFGINPKTGNTMIGGEAGAEAVAPISVLQKYVSEAVAKQTVGMNETLSNIYSLLSELLPELKESASVVFADPREGARKLAPFLNEQLCIV